MLVCLLLNHARLKLNIIWYTDWAIGYFYPGQKKNFEVMIAYDSLHNK